MSKTKSLLQVKNRKREVILYIGKSGYGKTTAAMRYVQDKHYVFLDRTNAFGDDNVKAVDDYSIAKRALDQWYSRPDEQLLIYATHPVNLKILQAFALLNERQIPIHGYLVIDEAQHFMSANRLNDAIEHLIAESRQSYLSLIFIARRINELHVNVRAAADTIHSVYQDEPGDLEILRKISPRWHEVTELENRKGTIVTLRKP